MNYKYKDIDTFKNAFYDKYPNSNLILLEFIENKKIKIRDNYGECIVLKHCLLKGTLPTIMTAINKTEYFINKAREVHGDKYDYSETLYINALLKINIFCKIHNEYFKQTVSDHLQGCGCKKCGIIESINKNIKPEKLYIEQLNNIWKGKYTIKENTYIKDSVKILHFCNEEKYWFLSKPTHMLCGHGCPKCKNKSLSKRMQENPLGWSYSSWEKAGNKSKNFDSFKVYIIKCWNDEEEFYKVGKTFTNIKKRFEYKGALPYNWEIIKLIEGDAKIISELENKLKNMNKNNKYIPKIKFNEMYECFNKIIE
jgi:hypothetical protein